MVPSGGPHASAPPAVCAASASAAEGKGGAAQQALRRAQHVARGFQLLSAARGPFLVTGPTFFLPFTVMVLNRAPHILQGHTAVGVASYIQTVTLLCCSLLSVRIGAYADRSALRHAASRAAVCCGAVATVLFGVVTPGVAWLLLVLLPAASVGLEFATQFGDSFLPDVSAGTQRACAI